MKWFFCALIFLSLGFWLGSQNQKTRPSEVSTQQQQTDLIKEKFQKLTDQEIQEYYLLKTEQEKYKKAEEILGKIVVLLLQDLGVRVSQSTLKAAEAPVTQAPMTQVSGHEPSNQIGSTEATDQKTPKKFLLPENVSANPWILNEKKLSEMTSPTEVAEYLNQVKIENFEDSLKQSKSFTNSNQNLSDLTGRYKGAAQVVNRGKNTVWEIELNLQADMRGPTLRGMSHIMISENGKTFSNSKDRGEVMNFREFSGGSQATLIRASPSINFQTYYIKSREAMIGNVYQLNKSTIQYEHIGTFELRRE